MRRNHKAQFQHVFTFIMLIIIAGVVLLLGYKFLGNLLGQSCDVEELKFQNQIESDLKQYASYGSFHRPDLPAPCNAEAICFVDASKYGDAVNGIYPEHPSFTYADDKTIESAVQYPDTPPFNVFIVYDDHTKPLAFSEKVQIDGEPGVLCIDAVAGKFHAGFAGKGRTVLIGDVE